MVVREPKQTFVWHRTFLLDWRHCIGL
jgi:hypothetical protein